MPKPVCRTIPLRGSACRTCGSLIVTQTDPVGRILEDQETQTDPLPLDVPVCEPKPPCVINKAETVPEAPSTVLEPSVHLPVLAETTLPSPNQTRCLCQCSVQQCGASTETCNTVRATTERNALHSVRLFELEGCVPATLGTSFGILSNDGIPDVRDSARRGTLMLAGGRFLVRFLTGHVPARGPLQRVERHDHTGSSDIVVRLLCIHQCRTKGWW